MSQLDTADRQTAAGEEPSATVLLTKTRLKEKLSKLEEEVKRLAAIEKALLASPDKQISLTDPDCRSMATSGRGSGMVAYNVQSAVDTTNHLIVAHDVTNIGTDRSQLATMAQAAKAALRSDNLDVVTDRGYFKGGEILACEQAGVAVTLPKPQTSGAKSAGRFGKPDFVYLAKDDVYRCPAGEKLAHHFTADEGGQKMRIYLTKACCTCALKDRCTTANERRIKRWEHEHVVEAAQTRLDQNPQAMRVRRETVEHPFATLKMRMGATHFLMKTLICGMKGVSTRPGTEADILGYCCSGRRHSPLARRATDKFFECSAERSLGFVADFMSDGGNLDAGICQALGGNLHPPLGQILNRRIAHQIGKSFG